MRAGSCATSLRWRPPPRCWSCSTTFPSLSGSPLSPVLVERVAREVPGVAGIKLSGPELRTVHGILARVKAFQPEFSVMVGAAELSLRLRGAQNSLAKRGELRFRPPTGFVWGGHGFEKDPDLAVQSAIGMIFRRFTIEPSVGRVVRWARETGLQIPTRRSYADGTSELTWNALYLSRLKEILKNPIYAGAYAYGRRSDTKVIVDGEIHTLRRCKGSDEWTALIEDAHEGYITWEAYLKNQQRMRDNAARRPNKGAPREGRALLTGVLLCGRCGRPMTVRYQGSAGHQWAYVCVGENSRGAKVCWTVSGAAIDAAVEDLLLRMIIPSELDLTLAVEQEIESQSASLNEQWKLRLEKAQYEARRCERRYKAVDLNSPTCT